MNYILEKKYPYLSNFFETAINSSKLFHSIILHGNNNLMQYAFALELARQLNCLEDKRADCTCRNCKWVRENKHPAVMTISKIDNKTDSSKTVISIEQIHMLLDTLINSSDYRRVFIFCDAQMKTLTQSEVEEYNEFKSTKFNLPQENKEDKIWYPSGINTECFKREAANAMLKSLEEPPENVTFIFLANNKDDLLPTIISRSQVFYTANPKFINYNTDFLKKYFSSYPSFRKDAALDFAGELYEYGIKNNYEPSFVIDCIQYYLCGILKAHSKNLYLVQKIYKDIKKTEEAKKMLAAYIDKQHVYENLAFYFANF